MVSMPFSTLATPLISANDHMPQLLSAARAQCNTNRCSHLEIRSMKTFVGLIPGDFSEVSRFRHHVIDLSQPIEAIFKKLDRSCVRQRITRAESNNIIIQKGSTQSDLRDFFNLYLITRRRVGRPAQPFRFFRAIWDQCYTQGLCELLFACKDGKRLAGLLLLKYKTRVSAEWAASDDAFKQMSPNQFVFWQAIKDAREKGFLIFDFGRTASSNKGLMDFKNRWGAAESGMFEIFYPAQQFENAEADESSFAKRAMLKICQIAPDFLQEPLGSAIYKHLG
jgi:lipid II:glycine glycyltransferase (peptidoglycan interpeptide bridge formation enzyme)